jgi:uncharacterized protein (TIRG00374 family)
MKKQYYKYILHAVILGGVILAAAKYLNGEEVLNALRSFDYFYLPFILLISAGYIVLKGVRFVILMRPITNLPWGTLVRGYVAGTAATLVPGGVAARAGLMRQAGVAIGESSAPVLFSSVLDQAAFVLSSLAAALWFEAARVPVLILLGILVGSGVVFAIPAARNMFARGVEWLAKRFKVLEHWHDFLGAVKEVVTWRIMLVTLGTTLIGIGLQIVMLDLSLRGLGLEVPYPALFLAYILPAMIGRLSALPAGVGVTEAGMVGFLVSTSGVDPDTVAAGAAIFRVGTVLFQALLGGLVYWIGWEGEDEAKPAPAGKRVSEGGK